MSEGTLWLSRERMSKKRDRVGRILFMVSVMLLGRANLARAIDMQILARNRLTVSDNIERATVGQEIEGYLLTMEGDFNLSGDMGNGTVDMLVGGGMETLKSDEFSDADNYRFRLNIRVPWATTGFVEGSAGYSEETEDPELTDINQGRFRTRRSNVGIAAGRRSSQTFQWQANVNARTERRIDRDLEETLGDLGWDIALDRRHSLTFDVGYRHGTEAVEGDSWTGPFLILNLTRQSDRLTSTGFRIDWEGLQLKMDDGTRDVSDMVSITAHYAVEMPLGWSFTSDLGLDGIKPVVDERRWEPRIEILLERLADRRVQFDGSLSILSSIQDPAEDQISWTRDSQVQTGLRWNLTSNYVVEPRVQYRYAELFGNGIADRKDKTLLFEVGTRWSPSRIWSLDVDVVSETIESSESANDLAENRLDLTLSGTFF